MWEFDISFSYFSNWDNTVIESVSNFTFLERVLEKIEDVLFKLILLVISSKCFSCYADCFESTLYNTFVCIYLIIEGTHCFLLKSFTFNKLVEKFIFHWHWFLQARSYSWPIFIKLWFVLADFLKSCYVSHNVWISLQKMQKNNHNFVHQVRGIHQNELKSSPRQTSLDQN